ncbi:MAG: hypothetical protein ACO1QS_16570 [Verrucomicrobiota bacterium]
MAVTWTLKYGELEKTFEAWGLKGLSRRLRIEFIDDVTFYRPCRRADAAPLFEVDDSLQIFRTENGVKVKWFEGIVVDNDADFEDAAEGQGYVVAGPWYYLEHQIFKQIWKSYTGDPDNLAEVRVSRVLLGTKVVIDQLVRQHMRDQITEILDYAIYCGAPIQYDVSAIPAIFLTVDELLDRHCDEAIKRQLRLVPDLVPRWDYTFTPPKLIFTKRDDIVPVELPAFDGVRLKNLKIKECFDLRRPSVVIRYEITNTDDGLEWKQHATDKVPEDATGDELKAFMQTVNLQGFSRTTSGASLLSESILPDDTFWWKARVSWLNDAEVTSVTLGTPTRSGELELPYELTDGTFPPWLVDQGYSYELETVQVLATVRFSNGSAREELLSVDVRATDAPSRDYTNVDSYTAPETIPVGLAQELYNAVNRREFKGSFTMVERACSGLLLAGYTFNLTDGDRAEWHTMQALVNEVVEDVARGTSEIRFGPPPYLGLDEAMELLRNNRTRWYFSHGTARATGRMGIDSRIDLPQTSAGRNTGSGTRNHERIVVKKTVSDQTGSIDIDASRTIVGGVVREVSPRVMNVCVDNGDGTTSTKQVVIMASEAF